MIRLSFKNLMRNKSRSFLTTIGIIIGVAAIVSLVSISDGIREEAGATIGGLQYLSGMEAGALDDTLSYVDISILPRLARVRGVKDYASVITVPAESINGESIDFTQDFTSYTLIAGIQPEKAQAFAGTIYWYNVERGRMLEPGEDNSILVSEGMLDDYNLFLGNMLKVNGENFRIVGTIKIEGSFGSLADIIVMTLDKAREFSEHTEDEVGLIDILPDNPAEIDKLIIRLSETLGDELTFYSSGSASEVLGSFLGGLTTALWVVSIIAAVVGGVNVMNTMLMSVMERIQEFGVLKAIGWKNNHIILMIVGEAMIIGLVGGVVGVLLGLAGSEGVELVSGIPTSVSVLLIIQVLVFAMGVGLVSAIYPAIIAAGMSPIEAVTYE